MTPERIEAVAVIGAGEMGRGIAAVAALHGKEVRVQDPDESQLTDATEDVGWSYEKLVENERVTEEEKEAALDRFQTVEELSDAVTNADFVVEAGPEQERIKTDIFESIDTHAPERAIFATNTSGLSITRLAEATDRPEQVLGTHWFNPPMLMDLVEVITTEYTSEPVRNQTVELLESFNKVVIECSGDIPWFIVNRCMRPFTDAPAWLVYRDETTIGAVDSAMKYEKGFPMGPFELTDFTGGIQIRVESENDLLTDDRPLAFEAPFCPLIHELYEEGHYGRKTGKGFYDYTDGNEPEIPEDAAREFDPLLVWAPVINEAAKIVQAGYATVEDVDTGMKTGGNWPVGPFEKADAVGSDMIVNACVEIANRHERMENISESIPCDLLLNNAKHNETFY